MLKRTPIPRIRPRPRVRSFIKISFVVFLLILLTTFFLCFVWYGWLLSIPQPLPQQSILPANLNNSLIAGSYYETSVPPTGTAKYLSAEYRIWVPDGVQTLRGILVKQHGCGDPAAQTGLDHANDLQWQALAFKHKLALLGSKLLTGKNSCDEWGVIERGSENAFLKALLFLSQQSHHPELDKVPWVFWGHSGGADWGVQMMQKYPERTIAVLAMRCGGVLISGTSQLLTSKPDPEIFGVPLLFAEGQKDPNVDECLNLPKQIFYRYRKAGALWALAIEANAAHESGNTRLLAIPYLDAILTARLTTNGTKLSSIDRTDGWLGNPTTHAIAPVKQYKGEPLDAAWLPNEETARKWQQYTTTNTQNLIKYGFCRIERLFILKITQRPTSNCYSSKISPTNRPTAPTDIHITRIRDGEVVLTWNFSPELENGLPSFRIYRNNSLIKTFQGQDHNFGDAPAPVQLVLEFRDNEAKNDDIYTVSAFNVLGESVSKPVRLMCESRNHVGSVTKMTEVSVH